MPDPLVYETHCHTHLCRHAEGAPLDYAAHAARRGLRGIVVTCHNPMPEDYGHSGRMTAAEVPEYLDLIAAARQKFAGELDVRAGMECDYFPGYEPFLQKQIESLPLHYAIGSVHPFLAIWRRRFVVESNPKATQRNYFDQLAAAAETRLFDAISHPDLIKNMTSESWAPTEGPTAAVIQRALDRIAAAGGAMELNTSGLLKSISEMNPCPPMLRWMRERGIPVVVGADAHVPHRVAADFESAYDLLESAGYTHVSYFVDRRRHDIPLPAARASLIPI